MEAISAEVTWATAVLNREREVVQALIEDRVAADELQIAVSDRPEIVRDAWENRDTIWRQTSLELEALREIVTRLQTRPHLKLSRSVVLVSAVVDAALVAGILVGWPRWGIGSLFGLILVTIVGAAALTVYIMAAAERSAATDLFRKTLPRIRAGVNAAVDALLRTILNERTGNEAAAGEMLITEKAPTLVELGTYRDPAPSQTYNRLAEFIREHDTSAVGLCGPRGVGKTTAMTRLHHDDELSCIGVYIGAPVYYSASDLVRIIEQKLAAAVLKRERVRLGRYPRAFRSLVDRGAVRRTVLAVAKTTAWTVVFLGGAALIAVDNLDELAGAAERVTVGIATLIGAMAAVVAFAVIARKAWVLLARPRVRNASPLGQAAYDRIMDLTWQEEIQRAAKVAGTGMNWSGELSGQVTHTQKQLSHPENVLGLRDFFAQVYEHTGVRIVICIDELDKISSPGQAVELVNGLKDLLHVPGTHFVISVSTDAMHSFAMRGVALRDVFDSALDTVIAVERLSYQESRELLSKRVLYFPDAAAAFCHAWAGGHARDLIRTARNMVDAKRRIEGPVPIVNLVEDVIRADVHEAVAAAYAGCEPAAGDDQQKALTMLLGRLRDREYDLASALDQASRELAASPLNVYLKLAYHTWLLFREPRRPKTWQQQSAWIIGQAERIAGARWTMGTRPADADAILSTI